MNISAKPPKLAKVPALALLIVLTFLSGAVWSGRAQDAAEISGFVLVNCVASDTPISATFSGKPVLAEPGLAAGRATSGLGVSTGPGLLQVSHPEFESAELSFEVAKGTTPIVVVYLEKAPSNPDKKTKLALRQTPSNRSNNASFVLVLATDRESPSFSGTANGQPVQLQTWRPQKIESASITLETAGEEILSVTQEQPEAWYVFVSPTQDGGFLAVGVPQVIYEW